MKSRSHEMPKHNILLNNLRSKTVWSINVASLCIITKEKFLSKKFYENVAWKLVIESFLFLKNPL